MGQANQHNTHTYFAHTCVNLWGWTRTEGCLSFVPKLHLNEDKCCDVSCSRALLLAFHLQVERWATVVFSLYFSEVY